MVSDEALKKLQEQIAAWPMTQRFVVQQLIEDYRRNREDLRAYKDTGFEPEEVTALGNLFDYALEESKTLTEQLELLKRLRELAEADREGRLVVLPCKAGDTVYRIFNPPSREPVISAHTLMSVDYIVRWIDKFGKTVFLTREEAEKALKTKEG
jgi:hypothetical protein